MTLSTQQKTSRNLLVILSDEHDPRYMGCSGADWMHTPNMDALARRGTRFSNAYTPSPICVPARAGLATGRWTHTTGYWDNAIAYEGRWASWHHRLAEAGVRTEAIGKLHYRNANDPTGFAAQHETVHILDGIGLVWGSVRDPLPATRGPSPIFDELGAGESSYNRYDQRVTSLACDWLRERGQEGPDGQPWALFVGLVAPHMPLVVPQEWLDLYPQDGIPTPKLSGPDAHRHPWVERLKNHWDHDAALGTPERRQLARACYFGLISFLDAQVGRLLAAMEEQGLMETTTVVYSSDHGDNLGTRGLWNKSTLYRESTSVPMILAGPGVPADTVRQTNVNLVDLYPTALAACNVPSLPEESALPGASLIGLAQAPDDPQRIGFSEYHAVGSESAAYMLTRGGYKLHHYVGHEPELFHLDSDPEELVDLAQDPSHAAVRQALERELNAMLDPVAVDQRAKRDQNDLVIRFGGREQALARGNKGPTPMHDKYRMS
ncbi:sulfatase-like hydrolase/transferase [Hydrogenophaga sp. 2FB]|uniref:sulfatase-like hydrolase/transferase n=1 Tax=Hydrogenophaga sp. 2FB TaxID=2502187 RepID=UPI0010F4BBF6|nr:sulfatase-like hydrolase/transferase [Hydrogenophaga sp. 2FB]